MNVNDIHYRTIWLDEADPTIVKVIDQRYLPYEFVIEPLITVDEVAIAIKEMHIRGAGLIGATAGYGMYLAALHADAAQVTHDLKSAGDILKATRPTAVNLAWAVERQLAAVSSVTDKDEAVRMTRDLAGAIAQEDADFCRRIGDHGVGLIETISQAKSGDTVNILTHCNAGWLAFVDYGSATAPIYAAHDRGINVHVWVDETRPRNQGARLTAWELGQHGVPHTVIADNVGGHLMQHGLVDLVITGSDRTTYTGDVANKIGTYLKALAAHDNGVPFYVALPSSTFDWTMQDGLKEIPIEQRDGEEVQYIQGWHEGRIKKVLLTPQTSPAVNYGFDVTPARLVTGLITERGICAASAAGILELYPEKRSPH
ncbi:MAG: S-methyl-5-thioribose-1-phosphate isomerase [Leptolyngbyaceae bacterium]|nr:S-methyl-5-thioribose-1-phosphate isomerase [Leptolyngbyaceae bacterium]